MSAPMNENMDTEQVILELFEKEGVKFGTYTLKSGIIAPVYVDLRIVVSYPRLMTKVSELLWEASRNIQNNFKSICGVPYTALPLATVISANHDIPMLIRRKEAKGYGTKKLIEGKYEEGDKCLIIEDVCTSGSSVLDTVQALNTIGIKVTDAIVLLDREQGAVEVLKHHGVTLHSVYKISQVMNVLAKHNKIEQSMVTKVNQFLETNQFKPPTITDAPASKSLSYGERSKMCSHPVTKRLFQIMKEKESNLVLSADLTTSAAILKIVEQVGAHICIVKTHVDIIEDFSTEFINKLIQLSQKHNFLIFEDRKFADIGNTVKHQYSNGIYKISEWADIINAHAIPGSGIIQGLKEVGLSKNRGCLMVAQMSSAGNLATDDYTSASVKMAEENKDFVLGFICQKKLSQDPTLIHMTPGVKLEKGTDTLGQQYLTPNDVICNNGSDMIIVGRGITHASDVEQAAQEYKLAGYKAYVQRLQ